MPLFLENTYGDVVVLKVYRTPTWLFSHITNICKVLGPAVMVAMWALAIAAFLSIQPVTGIYLLFLAILLIFQELSWLISKLFNKYLTRDNCLGSCWRMFIWFDSWKRSIEYLVLVIIAFIIGGVSLNWTLFVGAVILLLLSVAYFLKAIRYTKIEPLQAAGADSGFTGVATAPSVPVETKWGDQYGKY